MDVHPPTALLKLNNDISLSLPVSQSIQYRHFIVVDINNKSFYQHSPHTYSPCDRYTITMRIISTSAPGRYHLRSEVRCLCLNTGEICIFAGLGCARSILRIRCTKAILAFLAVNSADDNVEKHQLQMLVSFHFNHSQKRNNCKGVRTSYIVLGMLGGFMLEI